MALLIDITNTPYGLSINGAYVKIGQFQGTVEGILVTVQLYETQAARQAEAQELMVKQYHIPVPTGDLFPGMYNELKKLTEFAGATDI